jgi:hypothetical protein
MEENMSSISKIFDTARTCLRYVVEWWRSIRSRNGTDDARRAQASRLLMQQSCAGLPIGGYPCGVARTDLKHTA